MSKETQGNENHSKRRVFKNFAEYWHFVKVLSQNQREVLVQSLSIEERRALHASYRRGGWNDLMMRNTCDQILEAIQKYIGIDLLDIRTKVMFGKPQLMQKAVWDYVSTCFEKIPWDYVSYIFDGIRVESYDEDYVKLSKYLNSAQEK